jgi:hypothetical protein
MGSAPWERERRVNGDEVVTTEVASGGDRRAVVAGERWLPAAAEWRLLAATG